MMVMMMMIAMTMMMMMMMIMMMTVMVIVMLTLMMNNMRAHRTREQCLFLQIIFSKKFCNKHTKVFFS